MQRRVDLRTALTRASGQEVGVADANVVLKDACTVLRTGRPSVLLHAVDARTALAFMSKQAFHEIGWMSAKAARWHEVSDRELRQLITEEYLPRIPVVTTPAVTDPAWMPEVANVTDLDDVVHVQVARLISADLVYSHDRDLRRPGFAPATQADYDRRVVQLSIVSDRADTEFGLAVTVNAVGHGTAELMRWTSGRLNIRPAMAWFGLLLALSSAAYMIVAPHERRTQLAEGLEPLIERISTSLERSDQAREDLRNGRLIAAPAEPQLAVRIASYLARNPDANMGELHDALALTTVERTDLSTLLRSHPAFEKVGRHGWAVGARRAELETVPRGSRNT